MKKILFGPYIGNFEQEILTFQPYVRWISELLGAKEIYISSHSNRRFLYDWIPDSHFLPVYEHLTRNEGGQNNTLHDDITTNDFKIIVKHFKNQVSGDCFAYNIPYTKQSSISYYQKIFKKIKIPSIQYDYILYIPSDDKMDKKIYNHVQKQYDVELIGDSHCPMFENMINNEIDYLENGYFKLLQYLTDCRFVITKCSFWTLLCNLYHIPVFSWGDGVIYKTDELYGFGNKKNYILFSDNYGIIIKEIEKFNQNV